MHRMPTLRDSATAAVGEPVEQWIQRHRDSSARLSYRQIARVLLSDHGIDVTPQTVWAWHRDHLATAEPAEPAEAGAA